MKMFTIWYSARTRVYPEIYIVVFQLTIGVKVSNKVFRPIVRILLIFFVVSSIIVLGDDVTPVSHYCCGLYLGRCRMGVGRGGKRGQLPPLGFRNFPILTIQAYKN